MENNEKGCCEEVEYREEPVKDNSNIKEKECGYEEEALAKPEDNEPCCGSEDTEDNMDSKEEAAGCGCGCGASEYVDVDESLVDNPEKPKVIAEDDFFGKFESYAHSIGIKAIGYTQLTPDLLIKDKFVQYPNTIVLTRK